MKKYAAFLSVILSLCMLTACAGTPVVYHIDCDCPTSVTEETAQPETYGTTEAEVPMAEGELKTGLAILTGIGESSNASAEGEGEGKYDVTMVAVLVDEAGVIQDCIIDGIAASVKFDAKGAITTDLTAPIQTKNELGENYGMAAYGGAIAEWDEQAAALADFAVGKTVEELYNGAIDETGKAPAGSDLASSATIYLGGYVAGIEAAVNNAVSLGAQGGDSLRLAAQISGGSSKSAAGEETGVAQLDVDVTALTMKDGVITSCALDSVQAKVEFDAKGVITTDLTAAVAAKNELGDNYGMVAWGGAIAEWKEQAASFAAYVTGKTLDEVAGIAVDERTAPADADLSSSVTIAIGGFQSLIQKAAQ